MKNYRIKDIAAMAGVSAGTVDRVLHKRGRVSLEAQRKVEETLKLINYQPNLLARSLATRKVCRLLILIPSFAPGEYWSEVSNGILKAEHEFVDFHLEVERLYFNQYDKSSFDELTNQVQWDKFQGVIIATMFQYSTLKLAEQLEKLSIPFVLIDAYISNTKAIAYYGTDSYRSGYFGGRLLFDQVAPNDNLSIFHVIRKGSTESTQVTMREKGFRDYLAEAGYSGSIFPISISAESPEENEQILNIQLLKNQSIKAGIIFNSRVHLVASFFHKKQIKDFLLIGYDTIEENVNYLKNGVVSHLISQRPEVQGYNAVKALFFYLSVGQIADKMNFMPLDILMKENIDYYNNYI